MPERCGDETTFKYKVTSELIDKYVTLLICRKKKFDFAGCFTEKITKEETKKIKWPDQEIEGQENVFYGGRKVDYKGLNKLSYKEKFEHQEFDIHLYQGPHKKRSAKAPLKIARYENKGPEDMTVRSMEREYWEKTKFKSVKTGKITILYSLKKTAAAGSLNKKFKVAFKDGVFTITITLNLVSTDPKKTDTSKVFKHIKKRVENFWNSESEGFNKWVYHRKECKRGEKCKCSVVRNSRGDYLYAGCCKVPFKVNLVEGTGADAWKVNIHYLNPAQIEEVAKHMLGLDKKGQPRGWGASNLAVAVNTRDLYYPENRTHTYAHEIGHLMGFPDQYAIGSVAKGAMGIKGPIKGAAWPISEMSIMGTWQMWAEPCHIKAHWFHDWINKMVDKMEPIESVK